MAGLMANKLATEYNDAVEEVHLAQPWARGFAMTDRRDGGYWFSGKVDKFLIYEEEFDIVSLCDNMYGYFNPISLCR